MHYVAIALGSTMNPSAAWMPASLFMDVVLNLVHDSEAFTFSQTLTYMQDVGIAWGFKSKPFTRGLASDSSLHFRTHGAANDRTFSKCAPMRLFSMEAVLNVVGDTEASTILTVLLHTCRMWPLHGASTTWTRRCPRL